MINMMSLGKGGAGGGLPAVCDGQQMCILVGKGGTIYGTHVITPFGMVTPTHFMGMLIFSIGFTNDGGGRCFAQMGEFGNEQVAGLVNIVFSFTGFAGNPLPYTWNEGNSRYETISVPLVDYMVSMLDQYVGGSGVLSNLVRNPTITTNTDEWGGGVNTAISRESTIFPNGGLLVEVIDVVAGSRSAQQVAITGLVIGRDYQMEADAYSFSTNVVETAVAISTSDNPVDGSNSAIITVEDEVQHLSFTFTATAETVDMYLCVLKRASAWGSIGDKAVFDNMSVRLV